MLWESDAASQLYIRRGHSNKLLMKMLYIIPEKESFNETRVVIEKYRLPYCKHCAEVLVSEVISLMVLLSLALRLQGV